MVSSKLLTGVFALLSVGAANVRVCYPAGSSSTLSTIASTAESSTATASSTVGTVSSSATSSSATDSSSVETTTSSATDSSTATSATSTDGTATATTTSASADTSSTSIPITSMTESSSEAASTSTSTFFPAGLFPCSNDGDCDARGGVCDPMRCGCINLMCYLRTTTMATMSATSTAAGSGLRCGSAEECVAVSLCLDQGLNICNCLNGLCVVREISWP